MVRIEPKIGKERPNVSWEEWDGMLRICFVRKNRTMRASWGSKEVLGLCERNYRVWSAVNNVPVDDTVIGEEDEESMSLDQPLNQQTEEEEEWGGIMDVDSSDETPAFFKELNATPSHPKTPSRRKKTRVAELVKEKIRRVLEDVTELADKRAGKCDENDFLRLLYAFNEEGLHFA